MGFFDGGFDDIINFDVKLDAAGFNYASIVLGYTMVMTYIGSVQHCVVIAYLFLRKYGECCGGMCLCYCYGWCCWYYHILDCVWILLFWINTC